MSLNLLQRCTNPIPSFLGCILQYFASDGQFLGHGHWCEGFSFAYSLDVSNCVCMHHGGTCGVLLWEERVGRGEETLVGKGPGEGCEWDWDREEGG